MDGVAADSPEEAAAIVGARSDILRRAIDERIANRKGAQALALFDEVKDQLAPADRWTLELPVQTTRFDQIANQWIARETGTVDPAQIVVASDDKEKRPRLRGSANRPRPWSDEEVPSPKQLDPFAGSGGGGGFRPSRIQRSSPKSGEPAPKSAEPATGGTRKYSPQELQRRQEQLEENKANGRAWEVEREEVHRKTEPDVGTQVTVQTPTGSRGRIDIITRDSDGKVECFECKASETAPVREKQQKFFDDLGRLGGTVVGDGKPTFEGGFDLPPTPMQIERKRR